MIYDEPHPSHVKKVQGQENLRRLLESSAEPMSYADLRACTGLGTGTLRRYLKEIGAVKSRAATHSGRTRWRLKK